MSKTLVACFSATGNTAAIGKRIAEITGADYFEIKPAKPYTPEDLNWNDKQSRSSLEMNDRSSRPAIAGKVADMAEYKTIFLGFPIWWYEAPRIIYSFLDAYDLAGKAIITFVTSGSSGLGKTIDILQKDYPQAHWLPGKRFSAGTSAAEIGAWVKEHTDWKN